MKFLESVLIQVVFTVQPYNNDFWQKLIFTSSMGQSSELWDQNSPSLTI
jgi:hypothetical protein